MLIWVDADATPGAVREIVYRTADRLRVETRLVANHGVALPPGLPMVTAVRVDGGADAADRHIAEHARPGDVAITEDVPLATLLVAKAVAVIDPCGEEHAPHAADVRLSVGELMTELRTLGAARGGPGPCDAAAQQAFALALDRAVTRGGMEARPG